MKHLFKKSSYFLLILVLAGSFLTSCSSDSDGDSSYILQKEDIVINEPKDGFVANLDQPFKIEVRSVSDDNVTYNWLLDTISVSTSKNFEYTFTTKGVYELELVVKQNERAFKYSFSIKADFAEITPPDGDSSPYITKVFDFLPAVGQYTNVLPKYNEGDTQEDMNKKVLAAIGNNKRGMISLGGFGGYVVVGFDHTIQNIKGKRDFRVLGNPFYSDSQSSNSLIINGQFEPGIIMVAYDKNKNGIPDDDEWYEIAGSAHIDPKQEPWYQIAVDNKNNVNLYKDYEITYYKPDESAPKAQYVKWEDNQGNTGFKVKNIYHKQSYYPQWVNRDRLTFKGTCLPQNGVVGTGSTRSTTYQFRYGYADNELDSKDNSAIDIDWAVDRKGEKVNLPGVDFIKIYTGVNQEVGALGEISTEVMGVNDLHLLKEDIATLIIK